MGHKHVLHSIVLFFVVFIFSHNSDAAKKLPTCTILLGTLNSQNFFVDPEDPKSQKAVDVKIKNLGDALASLNDGKGPDFMGLEEVGDATLQERLVQETKLKTQGYKEALVSGQPDQRGIDVGFISKFELVGEIKRHVYWDAEDPLWNFFQKTGRTNPAATRVILEATVLLPNGETLTVFINHWPSRLSGDWATVRRYMAAKFLKKRTAELLAKDPNINIVAMGDFNCPPWGAEIHGGLEILASTKANIEGQTPGLFSLNETEFDYPKALLEFKNQNPGASREDLKAFKDDFSAKQGTYWSDWNNRWDVFDQLIVSTNMMKKYIAGSFKPINKTPFADTEQHPQPFNLKSGKGVADHLPVVAGFVLEFPK